MDTSANFPHFLRLPEELQLRVLGLLPRNDLALSCRFTCKGIGRMLSQPHHTTILLSQPLPPWISASHWQQQWQAGLRKLTFAGKLRLLSTAAASGSEVNLEVAWRHVRPCLFPDLLPASHLSTRQPDTYSARMTLDDPGVAAAKAGHAHLLPWLVEHCCPLDPLRTLEAAAQHCDLAGLQNAWQLLAPRLTMLEGSPVIDAARVVRMAGRSLGLDARDKVAWLLDQATAEVTVPASGLLRDQLLLAAAQGAAAAGKVPLLRWLSGEQGLDLAAAGPGGTEGSGHGVLACAMEAPDVGVAEWLVDEAGHPLPGAEDQGGLEELWRSAGANGDVAKLQWLVGRGVPLHPKGPLAAAEKGRLDAVRYLHEQCGVALSAELFAAAAGSGSVPLVSWLLDRGCPTSPEAYKNAVCKGRLEMVVWMAEQVDRSPWGDMQPDWLPNLDQLVDQESDLKAVHRMLETGALGRRGGVLFAMILDWAAFAGHVELLHTLNAEIKAVRSTLMAAAWGGCEAALELLLRAKSVRAVLRSKGWPSYVAACHQGDYATSCYLRRRRVPWGAGAMAAAVDIGVRLPVLRWMAEEGAPWDCEAVGRALMEAEGQGVHRESSEWLRARNEKEHRRGAQWLVATWGIMAAGTAMILRDVVWLVRRHMRLRQSRRS